MALQQIRNPNSVFHRQWMRLERRSGTRWICSTNWIMGGTARCLGSIGHSSSSVDMLRLPGGGAVTGAAWGGVGGSIHSALERA